MTAARSSPRPMSRATAAKALSCRREPAERPRRRSNRDPCRREAPIWSRAAFAGPDFAVCNRQPTSGLISGRAQPRLTRSVSGQWSGGPGSRRSGEDWPRPGCRTALAGSAAMKAQGCSGGRDRRPLGRSRRDAGAGPRPVARGAWRRSSHAQHVQGPSPVSGGACAHARQEDPNGACSRLPHAGQDHGIATTRAAAGHPPFCAASAARIRSCAARSIG